MRASFVLFAAAALALCAVLVAPMPAAAQVPIPNRPDGWQIGGPLSAPIVLDAFFDVLCPDCAGAWPTVKQLVSFYGAKLAVNVHTFPLPYHFLGFPAAQAARVCVNGGADPTAVLDFFFAQQSNFWNNALDNATYTQVQAQLGEMLVLNKLTTAAAFVKGMADPYVNNDARISWKYGCSRTVSGTPTFFVNGVFLNADPTWTLADWRSVLDPLLQAQPTTAVAAVEEPAEAVPHHRHRHSKCSQRSAASRVFVEQVTDCPAGEPACTYLPGKTECCFAGEMCIPNVGCRC